MEKKNETFEELIKKVDEFEKTVLGLLDNIKRFRAKLKENKDKYGPDTSKWPGSASGGE